MRVYIFCGIPCFHRLLVQAGFFPTKVFPAISVTVSYLSTTHLINRLSSLPRSNQRQHRNQSPSPTSSPPTSSTAHPHSHAPTSASVATALSPSLLVQCRVFPHKGFPRYFSHSLLLHHCPLHQPSILTPMPQPAPASQPVAVPYFITVHLINRPSSLPRSNQRQHRNRSVPLLTSCKRQKFIFSVVFSVSIGCWCSAGFFPTKVFPCYFSSLLVQSEGLCLSSL